MKRHDPCLGKSEHKHEQQDCGGGSGQMARKNSGRGKLQRAGDMIAIDHAGSTKPMEVPRMKARYRRAETRDSASSWCATRG